MSKYGVKIDIGEQEFLWVTEGWGESVVPVQFDTSQEAIDYCKQVWSGAWASGRATVERINEEPK